jgi:hypothetical protein
MHSTPGQAQTDAALTQLRQTLEMLANSDRRGCATGVVRKGVRRTDQPGQRVELDPARHGIVDHARMVAVRRTPFRTNAPFWPI